LPRGDYQAIQRSVLPDAHKGNCIAANIARQTMYALGQDMMLEQLFQEEARCSGPLSRDEQESLAEVDRKAESADPFYLVVRGILRLEGRGMPVNREGAVEDIQLAARRGSALAKYDLGKFYSQGTGVEQDRTRALSLYQEAAAGGIPGAWYNVGCMHNEAQAGPRDVPAAMRAWEKGAQLGHAWSQYNLGLFYSLGEDVPQDRAKAAYWLKKAGKQGLTRALDHLLMYYREESSDMIATAELSQEAKGCREACFKTANDCRKGCSDAECFADCREGLNSCLGGCE
jgi:TPR repeat protein